MLSCRHFNLHLVLCIMSSAYLAFARLMLNKIPSVPCTSISRIWYKQFQSISVRPNILVEGVELCITTEIEMLKGSMSDGARLFSMLRSSNTL